MDMRTAFTLAIRSLEGEMVFPREAGEAAALMREFVDHAARREAAREQQRAEPPTEEQQRLGKMMAEGFSEAVGIPAEFVKRMVEGIGILPLERLKQTTEMIEARMKAGGLDPEQVQADLDAAMKKGDQAEVTAIINRMKDAVLPFEIIKLP
jgi:hypothetical protein